MFGLVLRQLRLELTRTALTVFAISGVIVVILILEGMLAGMYYQMRAAVLNRGGDLIVTQSGISNFIGARSILPQTIRLDVEEIEGVEEAAPLTGISVIYERDGSRTPLMAFVYDITGGPTEFIAGDGNLDAREIIIDEALAIKYGLALGDPIALSDFEFRVGAVSVNSSAFFTPFVFMRYDDLIDFYFDSDIGADIATFPLLSFLLVAIEDGFEPTTVAAAIEERILEADVFFPNQLAERDENLAREMIGPILGLLLYVSYGIGVVVVAMFLFASVRARLQEFGILKALGFKQRTLALGAIFEALIVTALALPLGIFLANGLSLIIQEIAPIYLVLAAEPAAIIRTATACALFAVIGALFPVRMIARLDPASVFKG